MRALVLGNELGHHSDGDLFSSRFQSNKVQIVSSSGKGS